MIEIHEKQLRGETNESELLRSSAKEKKRSQAL